MTLYICECASIYTLFYDVALQNQLNKFSGIPARKELVPSIQTNDDETVDRDVENLTVTSKIHSKKPTPFGSTQQIPTTYGL